MTLDLADRLVDAALLAGRARGFAAAVAVVDAGGHLVSFRRDDGAGFLSVSTALRKAWSAASAGLSTLQWSEMMSEHALAPLANGTGLLPVPGGMPLIEDDRMIGGIGVAGGSPAADHEVARSASLIGTRG